MPVEFVYLQLDHPASEHIFGTLSCYTDSYVYTTYVYKLTGWEENWRIELRSLIGQTTMVVKVHRGRNCKGLYLGCISIALML